MIKTVLAALRCPICHAPFEEAPARQDPGSTAPASHGFIAPARRDPGSTAPAAEDPGGAVPASHVFTGLRCRNGHVFDRARQGYVHLGTGRKLPAGDTAEMVAARTSFLEAGHYEPLRAAISEATPPSARLIADVGAGPGYYLRAALERAVQASGLAIDVSKAALKRAARSHERAEAVLADAWAGLPIRDGQVDVLLNVFAPRNGAEFARVLKPGGILIVVTPREDHLKELRQEYGLLDVDPAKDERIAQALRGFQAEESRDLTWPLDLTAAETSALVGMGPNAFHTRGTSGRAKTRASVRVTTYVERSISSQPAGGS
jgi:23S rRNA (guanine745-N1)-methyltransferase